MTQAIHTFMVDTVKLAKKGQITIPKSIRDEDGFQENEVFVISHLPGGEIVLRPQKLKNPEERMLELIRAAPSFDAKAAWKEVREERRRERI